MSSTPRTDAGKKIVLGGVGGDWEVVHIAFSRQLERELNESNKIIRQQQEENLMLKERIKRLEEAGIKLRECASWVGHSCCQYVDQIRRAKAAIETWDKEAKL